MPASDNNQCASALPPVYTPTEDELRDWVRAVIAREPRIAEMELEEFSGYVSAYGKADLPPLEMLGDDVHGRVSTFIGEKLDSLLYTEEAPRAKTFVDLLLRIDDIDRLVGYEHYLALCVTLFTNVQIFQSYPPETVENVLWNMDTTLRLAIHSNYVQLPVRVEVATAAYYLFLHWYARQEQELQSCFMFWDTLCYRSQSNPAMTPDERAVHDALYASVAKVLLLPSRQCQRSALHGFNHLQDDRCQPLIDAFLATCADEELREYAEQCRTYNSL